jgi:hypothetical protein
LERRLKLFRFILSVSLCCLSLNSFGQQGSLVLPKTEDPEILIYSESHTPKSVEKDPTGRLKIVVTSLYPLRQLYINTREFPATGDTRATFELPYRLRAGDNVFRVTAVTDRGRQQKDFVLTFGEAPPPPKKSPFMLVAILGASSLDNVTSVPENPQSGSKTSLILVPQYDLVLGETATLRFMGVLLREKFSEADFAGIEISYSQLLIQWRQAKTFLGDLAIGIGMNDIRSNNQNPLLGEDETLSENLISVNLLQNITPTLSWDTGLEFKTKDAKTPAPSPNDEAGGRETRLNVGVGYKSDTLTAGGKIGYSDHDALGDYQDSTSFQYGVKAGYTLGNWVPGLGYDYKEKTKTNENAAGIAQQDKSQTVIVKLDYRWQLISNSQISLVWNGKTQTSNVPTAEFSASVTTLNFIFVF